MSSTIRENYNHLFNEEKLDIILIQKERSMLAEIDGYERNYILNVNMEDLCSYLEKKYCLGVPTLKDDAYITNEGERDVEVSQNEELFVVDRSKPTYIKGTFIEFAVPFEGESFLFKWRPSKSTMRVPYGAISTADSELRFVYIRFDHNHAIVKRDFEQDLEIVRKYLTFVESDVLDFNNRLKEGARKQIEMRREKLLKDLGMVHALGYPIKKYEDAQRTYTIPITRKRISFQRPAATTEAYSPEPTLESRDYEDILKIISNMALVAERNPRAFNKLKEEDIRTLFLMFLNGQYEGNATGETFNFEGKTDILIREKGRNIFIAECKFWKGREGLKEAIDQLLGYASWRDTKTALILFNRNRNLSAVLKKIPEVAKSHPKFKRQLSHPGDTLFRYVFGQRDDDNREILLTLLIFDMPSCAFK